MRVIITNPHDVHAVHSTKGRRTMEPTSLVFGAVMLLLAGGAVYLEQKDDQ